jgi:hypothetical protein
MGSIQGVGILDVGLDKYFIEGERIVENTNMITNLSVKVVPKGSAMGIDYGMINSSRNKTFA